MEKKTTHIIWALSSLLALIIFQAINIFTFYNGDNKEVVSHISLSSSIVSIILAVLAIVYTYYQNASIENSSKNIGSEVARLKDIIDEFRKFAQKLDKLDASLQSNIEEIRAIKEKLFSKLPNNSPSWDSNDLPDSKDEEGEEESEDKPKVEKVNDGEIANDSNNSK